MSEPSVLAVDSLHVAVSGGGHRGLPLVERVDLRLAPGEVMGLVGETGAGKTLTMKALLGLLPGGTASAGSLALSTTGELDLGRRDALDRVRGREIGMVLQNPVGMFDPLMRIGHQLAEGVVRRKLLRKQRARERARELLGRMGFDDPDGALELYPHQLSGGMAQRAAIAMVLMPRPRVIVADEPTSALDAHIRGEVLELLRRHAKEEGAGVVIVSHDLGLVSHYCDTIVVMYAGRVLEHGDVQAVLASPQHPYTRALLECSPALDAEPRARLRTIPGAPPPPGSWPTGCVFAPRCPLAVARCVEERPELRGREGRGAACHFAFGEEP